MVNDKGKGKIVGSNKMAESGRERVELEGPSSRANHMGWEMRNEPRTVQQGPSS